MATPLLVLLLVAAGLLAPSAAGGGRGRLQLVPDVARRGSQLIDKRTGAPVVLKGVATMFAEGSCILGTGFVDGPSRRSYVPGLLHVCDSPDRVEGPHFVPGLPHVLIIL